MARDPRVLRQIKWIQDKEWSVDAIGLGDKPSSLEGDFFQISVPKLVTRLLLYSLVSKRTRNKIFVIDKVPSVVKERILTGYYDVIHMNDLDFVPMISSLNLNSLMSAKKTRITIDLHEFFPGVKGGLIWRMFLKNYNAWLFKKFLETDFDSYSTVSHEIARQFMDRFNLPSIVTIWNAPANQDLTYDTHQNRQIEVVYHGSTGKGRPLLRYILAVKRTSTPMRLHLMVNAGPLYKRFLKISSRILMINDQIVWHETVSVHEIVMKIRTFDAQLVWFPPVSENMHLCLGNKFFEAIQGHLALISGPGPSMAPLIEDYGLGVVSAGWNLRDLVSSLDSLDRASIERYRRNSSINAKDLSESIGQDRFVNEVILNLKNQR
jgi:hypothetical protein